MSDRSHNHTLDRNTEIGALSDKVRRAVDRIILFLSVAIAVESAILFLNDRPGAVAFMLMGIGTCVALKAWCGGAIGLPLLPMMAVQSLVIYGVPIAVGHTVILSYPKAFVSSAGVEVLVFDLAMILAWKLGMQAFQPSQAVSYALQDLRGGGSKGWSRLGFGMVIAATTFDVLQSLTITDSLYAALPSGASSILAAMVSVVSACGFFLVSMAIGGREASSVGRVAFWALLVVNGMMSASEFLLYSAAANLITVAIGFFWSSGKIPWRYLTVSMLCLSFLNTGKTTMRDRHWSNDDYEPAAPATFGQLPSLYAEWIGVSYDAFLEDPDSRNSGNTIQANKGQSLLDRIDNLQNLLFVIDAVDTEHVKLLNGATYTLIPPLLVPRILWPNKPRSHEGQIILNVHFGRQDLNSTFSTYIAWGLLPEAYGNFGPIAGAIAIGGFLGLCFSWIENFTARKIVLSMEGFLSLSLLMNLMNSFEMVASVLVTSIFQSFVIVVIASAPFARRTVTKKPQPDRN
ncbi:MAG TPA: hypothetical protein VII09_09085 [Opitutaceae bacterium]